MMITTTAGSLPRRLRLAVLVVFSLLALAVIASEARSQNTPASPAVPAVQHSLLVSHVSALGISLLRAVRR